MFDTIPWWLACLSIFAIAFIMLIVPFVNYGMCGGESNEQEEG